MRLISPAITHSCGLKEPRTRLYFKGPSACHDDLLWRFYERHRSLTQDRIPFDRYINAHFIANRLSGGFGMLAEGPDRLVREYASVLEASDLEPYFPYVPEPVADGTGRCANGSPRIRI